MAQIKVTLKKSLIGEQWRTRRVVNSMGLRKVDQSRVFTDSDSVRGMIRKASHLLKAEPVPDSTVEETNAAVAETSA